MVYTVVHTGRVGHSPRNKTLERSSKQKIKKSFCIYMRCIYAAANLCRRPLCVWRALRIMSPPEITHQRTPRAGPNIILYTRLYACTQFFIVLAKFNFKTFFPTKRLYALKRFLMCGFINFFYIIKFEHHTHKPHHIYTANTL